MYIDEGQHLCVHRHVTNTCLLFTKCINPAAPKWELNSNGTTSSLSSYVFLSTENIWGNIFVFSLSFTIFFMLVKVATKIWTHTTQTLDKGENLS